MSLHVHLKISGRETELILIIAFVIMCDSLCIAWFVRLMNEKADSSVDVKINPNTRPEGRRDVFPKSPLTPEEPHCDLLTASSPEE